MDGDDAGALPPTARQQAEQTDPAFDGHVQRAVEQFVERHATEGTVDLQRFVAGFDEPLRAEILARCREFLAFDGLLGRQHHVDEPRGAPAGDARRAGPAGHEGHDGSAGDTEARRRFGEFEIEAELGRGGMGVVYLAHQPSLDRRVALKVMASGLTLSRRHVERFRREAMATAQLRHPAIVPVHSLVEVDGTFALAMDYVAGRNLADVLDDLRLQSEGAPDAGHSLGLSRDKGYVAECAMLVAQVASALAAAHEQKVVHRDLKPRNLMLDEQLKVRLLDFGLAKSLDNTRESLSMSGEITGTAHYLSPEQTLAKRVDVDHRADIWSLGVILYELLTLQRPFDGKNLQQIVYQICFQEPVAIQRRNPKVPRDLVTICLKALEKDPAKRYATAAEFEADLLRFLRWEPIHARPATAWTRLSRFVRRHRKECAVFGLLLATAAGLGGAWWLRRTDEHGRADALLLEADQRAAEGRVDDAIDLGSRALDLRNDAETRERLERFRRVAMEAAWMVAESKQLVEHDRARALQLALEAERRMTTAKTRSAVLDALGAGFTTRELPTPGGRQQLVAAWSPSGRRVATGGYGATLQVLTERDGELATNTLLVRDPSAPPIVGLAFVDEQTLVSVSPDQTLRLWPLEGGAPHVLALDGMAAAALRTSDDGRIALVAAYDPVQGRYEALVYDLKRRVRTDARVAHDSYVVAAALAPLGDVAASCSGQRLVRVWHTADGRALPDADVGAGRGRVRELCFSPDGTLLAVGTQSGDVCLFDVRTGALEAALEHADAVTDLCFDATGARLLTGSRDLTAQLWQIERDAGGAMLVDKAGVLLRHDGPVLDVAFSPDGQLAVTTTKAGCVRIYDVGGDSRGGEPIHSYEVGESVEQAMFAPDGAAGHRVMLRTNRRVLLWDFASARGVVTARQPGPVPAVVFAPDGTSLVTGGDDERLRRFAARDGRQIWTTEALGNPVERRCLVIDGDRLAAGLVGGSVQIRALDDGRERLRLATGLDPAMLRFVDGERLLVAGASDEQGRIALWDLASRREVAFAVLPAPVVAGDVSPDGREVLVALRGSGRAMRLRLPDLVEVGTIEEGTVEDGTVEDGTVETDAPLRDVRFAPVGDAQLFATADEVVVSWPSEGPGAPGRARSERPDDPESAAAVAPSSGTRGAVRRLRPRGAVRFATFSPDGEMVLTGGDDGTAQLWRVADGEELLHFDGHRGTVLSGSFRGDGAWIATCARDRTTCIWPADPVAVASQLPGTPTAASDPTDGTRADSHATTPAPPGSPRPAATSLPSSTTDRSGR